MPWILLLLLIPLSVSSHAEVYSCVEAGKKVLRNLPCTRNVPKSTLPNAAQSEPPASLSTSTSAPSDSQTVGFAAEEAVCAYHWMFDEERFENRFVPPLKWDNPRNKPSIQHPDVGVFDFTLCGKYGYKSPSNLSVLSANRSISLTATCKVLEPIYREEVMSRLSNVAAGNKIKNLLKSTLTTGTIPEACNEWRVMYPDAAAIERYYQSRIEAGSR